jgi:ABC-type branched-subunit amino acid transport system substrate-binding protein
VVVLLAGACTSKSADDATSTTKASGGTETDALGVTSKSIKLSLIYADLSALSQQKLAPEIGIAKDQAEAVVAEINQHGGVAGRKLQIVPHVIEGAAATLSPEAGRAACLQATEDDKPFAVIITAAISADVVNCVAVEHKPITIGMDSFPASYYSASQGRLFSIATHTSLQRDRQYRAWPQLLSGKVDLASKKIGIIRTDTPEEEAAVDKGLKPALAKMGLDVAAEASLPCPEGSQNCSQHDAAIQKMKDAGVDFVFLGAQLLAGSATVEAAQNLQFKPQWTVIGNNVTDTVAQFFKNAKQDYNGAWGINTVFPEPSKAADACNKIVVDRGGKKFPRGSDGYGFTAVTCIQIQTLAKAIETIKGAVTQAKVIKALESQSATTMSAGPPGSLNATKHDAGDDVFLSRYDATAGKFRPVDDAKPLKVP